jgi:hypothetical protein
VLDLILLRALPLLVGCAAAIYLCLIRDRRWRVAHYAPRGRSAHFWVCFLFAAAVAGTAVFALLDEIACPGDRGTADLMSARSGRKGAVRVICRAEDGRSTDGSFFAPIFALLGAGALAFAGASAVLRRFGPPAPPDPPLATIAAPRDRREHRRERKQAEHRDRQS